ncbi:hypothetical protein C2845_PM01G25350 [Panicum miliaceum]|uniref:DUF7595 domain-containing protein n=1 Tax=Panicum miliaceum TaxID=4540 RepID=A0A3L6TGA3_PANMI|nr:hypothetical protein C2845_PM01G25350 [Panicum miliaceum]
METEVGKPIPHSRGPDAVVPSSILCVLGDTSFVYQLTLPAWNFSRCHLAPFVSRSAAGLLERYRPLTSRRGLVVLGRREINRRRRSERRSDLCVYDPLTNGRTFFPVPPDIGRDPYRGLLGYVTAVTSYVLLTAADGIACSFMLLAADMTKNLDGSSRIRVQTVSSSDGGGGQWGPVKTADHQCPWWCMRLDSYNDPAVVLGGVVHWLMHIGDSFLIKNDDVGEYILTYDVNTATVGSIDLPDDRQRANLEGSSGSQVPTGGVAGREAELHRHRPARSVHLGAVIRRFLGAARGGRHGGELVGAVVAAVGGARH